MSGRRYGISVAVAVDPGGSSMGLLDKIKSLVGKNKEPVKGGVDKAADVADDKTGGKYGDKIDAGAEQTKDALDKLDGKADGDLGAKPPA
jgi:hypothetical protein